jgi:hypothetical protein
MFAADGAISNVFTIDETDTVASDGKTYKGTFDFKLFDATNVFGTGTPLAEVTGTTAGTRITVDYRWLQMFRCRCHGAHGPRFANTWLQSRPAPRCSWRRIAG